MPKIYIQIPLLSQDPPLEDDGCLYVDIEQIEGVINLQDTNGWLLLKSGRKLFLDKDGIEKALFHTIGRRPDV